MADTKITAELELQTQGAISELGKVQQSVSGDLAKSFQDLSKQIGSIQKTLEIVASESVKTVNAVKTVAQSSKSSLVEAFSAVKDVLESLEIQGRAIAKAFDVASQASVKLANDFLQRVAKIDTAKFFGGFEEGAAAVKTALDNTVTSTEALQLSARFFEAGFTTTEAQGQVALLTKALAAAGQTTNDAVIEQLRAGEVTGVLSAKYQDLNPKIQAAIASFEAQNNVVASASDRLKISADIIQRDLGGAIIKLNQLNAPDLFDQISTAAKEFKSQFTQEFGALIAPSIQAIVGSLHTLIPTFRAIAKASADFTASVVSSVISIIKELKPLGDVILSIGKFVFALGQNFVEMSKIVLGALAPVGKALGALLQGAAFLANGIGIGLSKGIDLLTGVVQNSTKEIKAFQEQAAAPINTTNVKALESAVAAATREIQEEKRKQDQLDARRRALAEKEAAEEIKGFQTDARRQVRTFSSQLASNLAALGGSFAPIVGAQRQFFEQSRILTAQYGKGLFEIIKLRDEEIVRLQKTGQLSGSQAKAALLLQTIQQAGALNLEKILQTQQAVNTQLRNSLSLLSADAKLAQIRIDKVNLAKEVEANITTLRRANIALEAQGTKQSQEAIQTNLKVLAIFEGIRKERLKTLEAQFLIAQAEREQQRQTIILEAARLQNTALQEVREALLQIQKLRGQDTTIQVISSAELKRVSDLKIEIGSLLSQIGVFQARLQAFQLLGDNEQAGLLRVQLQALQSQIFAKQQLLVIASQQADGERAIAAIQQQATRQTVAQQNKQALDDLNKQITAQKVLAAQALQGSSEIQNVRIAGAQALVELDQKSSALQIRLQQLQAELAAGFFSESRTKQQTDVALAATQAQIDAMARLRAATLETNAAQLQGLTVTGQIVKSFSQDVLNFNQNFAAQIKGTIGDLATGVGGIIQNTFEGIVTGQGDILSNIGKQFLEVLAGMAAKLGAFFITTGIAQQFVPPYTGAGAIAGGVALLALSGALKGAASLISPVSAPKVASTSPGSPPSIPDRAPGTSTPREERAVIFNFAVTGRPWSRQNEVQEFSDFREWAQFSSRKLGISDPFAWAENSRGRR